MKNLLKIIIPIFCIICIIGRNSSKTAILIEDEVLVINQQMKAMETDLSKEIEDSKTYTDVKFDGLLVEMDDEIARKVEVEMDKQFKELASKLKSLEETPIAVSEISVETSPSIVTGSGAFVKQLLTLRDDQLTDWDVFRKHNYNMCRRIKKKYTSMSMDTIQLYDYMMKVYYAECKYHYGTSERYNELAAKKKLTKAERKEFRAEAYKIGINWKSNAKGLIQFMPSYRKDHKVPHTINEFKLHLQLPYVEQYLYYKLDHQWTTPNGGKIDIAKVNDFADVYCIIFAPMYADDDDDKVLYSKHRKKKRAILAYTQNKGYDRNNDGSITKGEMSTYIIEKHYQ